MGMVLSVLRLTKVENDTKYSLLGKLGPLLEVTESLEGSGRYLWWWKVEHSWMDKPLCEFRGEETPGHGKAAHREEGLETSLCNPQQATVMGHCISDPFCLWAWCGMLVVWCNLWVPLRYCDLPCLVAGGAVPSLNVVNRTSTSNLFPTDDPHFCGVGDHQQEVAEMLVSHTLDFNRHLLTSVCFGQFGLHWFLEKNDLMHQFSSWHWSWLSSWPWWTFRLNT